MKKWWDGFDREWICKGIFGVCILVFFYSSCQLVKGILEYRTGDREYKELQQMILQEIETTSGGGELENGEEIRDKMTQGEIQEEETKRVEGIEENLVLETLAEESTKEETTEVQMQYVDFATLKELNSDSKGWLILYGTKINYPVVQTGDNFYYLTHTFQGTENKEGTLFIDYLIEEGMKAKNVIIYGHNMKNGAMFGTLSYYKNPAMVKHYPAFLIYTEEGTWECAVFAAYMTTADSDTYTYGFGSEESFLAYIERMQAQSLYDTGVEVLPDDSIVTLSTCSGEENQRFVVQAKIVK